MKSGKKINISEKDKSLKETYTKLLEVGFGEGSLETIDQFIDDNVMGYGTAQDEKIMSIQEFRDLIIDQRKQAVNFEEFSFTSKPVIKLISDYGNTAVIVDEIVLLTRINGESNELSLRMSTVFDLRDGAWKLIHWHGSKPEHISGGDDPWHVSEWKKKNTELQKAVEEKTADLVIKNRELEFESALEKVRTIAMGMRKPNDMLDVCKTISIQLQSLGVKEIRNVQTAIFYEQRGTYMNYEYYSKHDKTFITETVFTNHEIHNEFATKMLKGKGETFITHIKGSEVKDWIAYQKTTNVFIDNYLETANCLNYYWFSLGPVALGISTYHPLTDEEINLFKRFLKVFELAYQRYLDIEKAETQAREAQIEAALERVRSRTMGMQRSDELQEAAVLLFQQVVSLGVPAFGTGFNIWDDDRKFATAWMGGQDRMQPPFKTSTSEDIFQRIYKTAERGESLFVEEQGGEALIIHYEYMNSIPVFKEIADKMAAVGQTFPTFQIMHCAFFSQGYLMFITFEPVPDAYEIFKRFAKVFEQTYTRFLDLKKAEAQAREAQIQLALERVRARTMAMQSSDELAEVSYLLNKQVVELGLSTRGCAFNIYNEHDSTEWFSSLEGTIPTYKTPRENIFLKYYEAGQSGETLFIEEYGSEKIKEHYKYLATLSVSGGTDTTIKENVQVIPEYQIDHVAYFKYGYLLFITLVPAPEAHDIFIRFAKEFEQTYTRFLDLKKAEAQAREAQIEAALERVRSRSMAMRSSSEIGMLIYHLYGELFKLDAQLDRCFIMIVNPENRGITWWLAGKEGLLNENGFFVQNNQHPSHQLYLNYWEERRKKWTYLFEGKEKEEWDRFGFSQTELTNLPEPVKKDMSGVNKIYLSGSSDIFGCLVTGSFEPLSDEHQGIISRFASVFNQTYTRFLDLQKAEAQAREAQIEASLERVRAHAMGLRNSGELQKIITIIFEELNKLGISLSESSIFIVKDNTRDFTCWTSSESAQLAESYSVPYFNHPILENLWKDIKNKVSFREFIIESEELLEFADMLFTLTDFKFAPDEYKNSFRSLDRVFVVQAMMKHGYLEVFGTEPLPHKFIDVLMRFTNVVDLTYTRFLDLQKAEAQAREAQIELSLERIRSQVTAMRESSELLDIVVTMRSEFVALGHEAHYFWHMRWLPDKYEKAMTSGDGTRIGMIMELPRVFHEDQRMLDWEKSSDPIGIFTYDADSAVDYVDKMIRTGRFDLVDHNAPGPDDIRHIGGLTFVMARTTHGEIGYSLPGIVTDPPMEDLSSLVRFAGVFDLAYKRFEDLKNAERQQREAEIELALERTRNQSMLMQHSSELNEISKIFHEQILLLGIDSEFSFVWLPDETKSEHLFWATWADDFDGTQKFCSKAINYPMDKSEPYTAACYSAWESGQPVHEVYVPPEDIDQFFKSWEELLRDAEQFKPELFPDGIYYTEAYMKYGCFGIDIRRPITREEKEILRRFSVEFERTYTRFLDLQKAEEQNKIIQAENDRKSLELEEARKLQFAMLPKQLPKLSKLDIAVYMRTATEVGGDYYDFSTKDNGSLNICIGDATGHGLKAGTLVSMMKSLFIADSVRLDIKDFFDSSNETLKKMSLSKMMIAFAMINIYGREIKISNAGIPPVFIYRKEKNLLEEINLHGLPIGAMRNTKYEVYSSEVNIGDTLLLLSDGLPELKNIYNEMYGYERLKEVFIKNVRKNSDEIISALENESRIWRGEREQDDDITFVVIKVK